MDDSPREEAWSFHILKIHNFCPQAAPRIMPQHHKPEFDPEKMSLPPLSRRWVSPGHHHSWQLLIQPTVEDGWCWRLLHSLDNPHESFTTGKFFQVSELKPSSCNITAIFSVFLSMDREIQIISSLKVHFMFLKTVVLPSLHVLSLQLKKQPSFFSLSLQAVLYGPAALLAAVLWLCPVGLSLTYLWLVNMLSTISRTIWSRSKGAERILY